MTIETLDKIAELLAKATPGDWSKHYGAHGGGVVRRWLDELGRRCTRFILEVHLNTIGGEEMQSADAQLVIELRNAASDLLDLAREALESRQLIEDAPHARDCANGCTYHKFWKASQSETWFLCDVCGEPDSTERHSRESGLMPCNCWKSRATR